MRTTGPEQTGKRAKPSSWAVWAMDRTVMFMHSIYLIRKETTSPFDAVIVEFVPFRRCGELGAWESSEWMYCQAVEAEGSSEAHA